MPDISRRLVTTALLAAPVLWLARPALAREPEIFSKEGVAINGTDAVAYFEGNGPVAGTPEHTVDWNGARWLFASAANAGRFEDDPTAFGPQFGGYCAYAASRGYLAPTIPEAWHVHDAKLYLNASLRARELWLRDIPGNIAKGKANWPGILG